MTKRKQKDNTSLCQYVLHSCVCCYNSEFLINVIVLEKRSNFAVKLIFQYEPLKTGTLIDFVHNSECLN